MSRKVLLLNFALATLLIWLGVRLTGDWKKGSEQQQITMNRKPQPQEVKAPPSVPAVEAPPATQYIEVATKMLFSKDRNPIEIIPPPPPKPEAPPPPPPPDPPPPPMPVYYGQMNFADPVLFLSVDGKQKSYHKGDKVGEFELAEFDQETLTLTWHEKTFNKTLAELKAKELPKAAQPAPAAASTSGGGVTKIGGTPSTASTEKPKATTAPQFGEKQGNLYMCAAGDTSADGTVLDGYRLKKMDNLFGATCQWEPMGK